MAKALWLGCRYNRFQGPYPLLKTGNIYSFINYGKGGLHLLQSSFELAEPLVKLRGGLQVKAQQCKKAYNHGSRDRPKTRLTLFSLGYPLRPLFYVEEIGGKAVQPLLTNRLPDPFTVTLGVTSLNLLGKPKQKKAYDWIIPL